MANKEHVLPESLDKLSEIVRAKGIKITQFYLSDADNLSISNFARMTDADKHVLEQINIQVSSTFKLPPDVEARSAEVTEEDLVLLDEAIKSSKSKHASAIEAHAQTIVEINKQRLVKRSKSRVVAAPKFQPPKQPSLDSLVWLNDLVPSPKVRKTLRKMIADQTAHVAQLHAEGKYKRSKLAAISTWAWWAWYFIKQLPWAMVIEQIVKRITG